MICKRCHKSIPDRAFQCPYCGKRTEKGWQKQGEKLLSPVTNLIKKFKKY